MSPELNRFAQQLLRHALTQPTMLALWGDELRLDYAALWADVEERRQRLREQRPQFVALALDNGPHAMLWDLAVLFEELPCLAVPPFFSTDQRHHCLMQSRADLVIAEPEMAQALSDGGYHLVDGFWRKPSNAAVPIPTGTAKITYTSGTTGTPKGVCLSAESFLRVARELDNASQPVESRHHLALLPLAILLENLGCYAALYAGATLSLPSQRTLGIQGASGVDPAAFLGCLTTRRPQSLILVPQLLQLLVGAAERGLFDPSALRFAAVGGAPVSVNLLARAQRAGLAVFEGYGLSECASVVCLNVPGANRPGSVGKPLPHLNVKLAADGEILVNGPTLLGYLGTAAIETTWLPTGDLGAFDDDGYLTIKGRKKNQFVTSYGRNVNPEWVEAELTQPGIIGQAFVQGEAMPCNVALLWPLDPTCSDQALDTAVAQANVGLPDYARIHHWVRLLQPFTAANGLLTANGRLRRTAIVAQYHDTFASFASTGESPS